MNPTFCFPMRTLCILTLALGLGACSKGIDRALVTGEGDTAYRTSLDRLVPEATQEQLAAFTWAVSDLNIQDLHARYPNASPREVMHGEADRMLESMPPQIARLQAQVPEWQAAAAQVVAVAATDISFKLSPGFFGLQPTITATVTNNSTHSFSRYGWTAELYLDDASEPVARTRLSASFAEHNGGGGLDPGASVSISFQVGFVSGDAAWKTLEIQRAAKQTVKMVPDPEAARDLANRTFLGSSPQEELAGFEETLRTAQQVRQL